MHVLSSLILPYKYSSMPKAQKIRETHINIYIYIYDGCQRENQKNEYKSTKGSKGTQILTH